MRSGQNWTPLFELLSYSQILKILQLLKFMCIFPSKIKVKQNDKTMESNGQMHNGFVSGAKKPWSIYDMHYTNT